MRLKMLGKLDSLKYYAVALLAVLFFVLYSFNAFSASGVPMGNEDTFKLQRSRDIYREVVSYEDYETTCTREVPDGTTTVCTDGRSERRCRKVPGVGEECWEETETSCQDVQTTRTEEYSCTQSRRVVENVYDYTISATVNVVKSLRAKNYDLNSCMFDTRLEVSGEDFLAYCSEAIVKATLVSKNEVESSGNKLRTYNVELDFFPIADLNALKFGLSGLKFENGKLTFKAFDLTKASNFKLMATLTRNRFLLKDKVVLSKSLTSLDFKVLSTSANGESLIEVDLKKLSSFDASKKHTLKLNLKTVKAVDVKGAINQPSLSNEVTQSLVINE